MKKMLLLLLLLLWPINAIADTTNIVAATKFIDPHNSTTTALGAGETYTGEWVNTEIFSSFIVTFKSDVQGDLYVERSADGVNVGKSVLVTDVVELNVGQRFSDSPSAKYLRLKYVNGSDAQTVMRLRLILSPVPTGASYQQLKMVQNDDTMAMNTISNISGAKEDGTYALVPIDTDKRLLVNSEPSTYGYAQGSVLNHFALDKFGSNQDTNTTFEIVSDLGTAVPTGYPYLTTAEALKVSSLDVDDQGLLQDSGTATGGSTTTLVDTAGDFVNDGVAVGDFLINDTQSIHGVITAVDATTITVEKMHDVMARESDGSGVAYSNASGDTYRVANANDTGAAVVSITGIATPGGVWTQTTEHIILNGTTDVTTTTSFLRIWRAQVHLAGSSKWNEGNILVEKNDSATALLQITATRNQTLTAQWTVPDNYTFYMNYWSNGESSNKGSQFVLLARPFGETFQTKDIMHLLGTSVTKPYQQPKTFRARTDIEVRVLSGQAAGQVDSGFGGWYQTN